MFLRARRPYARARLVPKRGLERGNEARPSGGTGKPPSPVSPAPYPRATLLFAWPLPSVPCILINSIYINYSNYY